MRTNISEKASCSKHSKAEIQTVILDNQPKKSEMKIAIPFKRVGKSKLARLTKGSRINNKTLGKVLLFIFGLSLILPNFFYRLTSYNTIRKRTPVSGMPSDEALSRRLFQVRKKKYFAEIF